MSVLLLVMYKLILEEGRTRRSSTRRRRPPLHTPLVVLNGCTVFGAGFLRTFSLCYGTALLLYWLIFRVFEILVDIRLVSVTFI